MRTPGGKAYWILFSNGVVTQFGEAPGSGASPPVRPDRSVPPQRSSRQPRARASGLGPPTVPTTTSETHHMTEACSGCALTHRSSLGSAGQATLPRGENLPRYAKSSSLRDSPEALRAINVAISSAAPSRGTAGVLVTGRLGADPFPVRLSDSSSIYLAPMDTAPGCFIASGSWLYPAEQGPKCSPASEPGPALAGLRPWLKPALSLADAE